MVTGLGKVSNGSFWCMSRRGGLMGGLLGYGILMVLRVLSSTVVSGNCGSQPIHTSLTATHVTQPTLTHQMMSGTTHTQVCNEITLDSNNQNNKSYKNKCLYILLFYNPI